MNALGPETNGGRKAYDDEYATCDRTVANLWIHGSDLDPSEITNRLGITPSSTQKRGEVFTNSRGRQRTAKLGGWFLTSEGSIQSKDLRRHLDWLLDVLRPRADALRSIQGMNGVWMTVNCVWWSKHGQGGPTLSPEQMRGLANLELECGFDISFYGDAREQDD